MNYRVLFHPVEKAIETIDRHDILHYTKYLNSLVSDAEFWLKTDDATEMYERL